MNIITCDPMMVNAGNIFTNLLINACISERIKYEQTKSADNEKGDARLAQKVIRPAVTFIEHCGIFCHEVKEIIQTAQR